MAHRPVPDQETPDECRICGRRIIGFADTLRHAGETVAIVVPAPDDLRVFLAALDAGKARAHLIDPDASLDEWVRAVVEGVYLAGLLRRRPGRPPPDALRRSAPDFEDWAARAAPN